MKRVRLVSYLVLTILWALLGVSVSVSAEGNWQLSNAFDKNSRQFIPGVAPLYADGAGRIRLTTSTQSGRPVNPDHMHGNRDYYAAGDFGKRSWWGQDLAPQNMTKDADVYSPISGMAKGSYDPNGGPYVTIEGDNGLWIRLTHCNFVGEERHVEIGEQVGRTYILNGKTVGIHVTTIWQDKDVPFTRLLPSNYPVGEYGGSWVDKTTPPLDNFDWIDGFGSGNESILYEVKNTDWIRSIKSGPVLSTTQFLYKEGGPIDLGNIALSYVLDPIILRIIFIMMIIAVIIIIGPKAFFAIIWGILKTVINTGKKIKHALNKRIKNSQFWSGIWLGFRYGIYLFLIITVVLVPLKVRNWDFLKLTDWKGIVSRGLGSFWSIDYNLEHLGPELTETQKQWCLDNKVGEVQLRATVAASLIPRDPKTGLPCSDCSNPVYVDPFTTLGIWTIETNAMADLDRRIDPTQKGWYGSHNVPDALRSYFGGRASHYLPGWKKTANQPGMVARYGPDIYSSAKASYAGAIGWTQAMPDNWYKHMKPEIEANYLGGNIVADPWDPYMAAEFTARYLVYHGGESPRVRGVNAYNPGCSWYAGAVRARAVRLELTYTKLN